MIGPAGIFALSTKANKGLLEVRDDEHLLNGDSVDFIRNVKGQAKRLHERLLAALDNAEWVQPVLVAPFAFIRDERKDRSAVDILHEDDLIAYFEDRWVRKLDRGRVFALASAVERIIKLRQADV